MEWLKSVRSKLENSSWPFDNNNNNNSIRLYDESNEYATLEGLPMDVLLLIVDYLSVADVLRMDSLSKVR